MVTSKTTSTVAVVDTGEHLFKVVGHSQVGNNASLTSEPFRVGGHDWAILYYPNGVPSIVDGKFTSVFIQLLSAIENDVTASYSFCLQDPASPATGEKNRKSFTRIFSPSTDETGFIAWGVNEFMRKDDLAASGCLVDDCLVIKGTVEISKLIEDSHDHEDDSIIVPPSNLSTDLRDLLESGLKADLTVKIGNSRSFDVNTCVLLARSPVFLEQLGDPMVESKPSSVCIEDMDAKVFEAFLHYIYSDCLPVFMEKNTEEATKLAQHLLIAAHQYRVERLKVMCESRLSKTLDVNMVGFNLDLAEKYECQQLKKCCLKYMATDGERLRAIHKTDGFDQLMKNHPLVLLDILHEVIDKVNKQVVTTPAPAPALAPAPAP